MHPSSRYDGWEGSRCGGRGTGGLEEGNTKEMESRAGGRGVLKEGECGRVGYEGVTGRQWVPLNCLIDGRTVYIEEGELEDE